MTKVTTREGQGPMRMCQGPSDQALGVGVVEGSGMTKRKRRGPGEIDAGRQKSMCKSPGAREESKG